MKKKRPGLLLAFSLLLGLAACGREPSAEVPPPVPPPAVVAPAAPAPTPAPTAAGPAAADSISAPTASAELAPAAPAPVPEKEYCASQSSEVFHRCSCDSVGRIKPEKLIKIPTRQDALASGRRPCKHCKP